MISIYDIAASAANRRDKDIKELLYQLSIPPREPSAPSHLLVLRLPRLLVLLAEGVEDEGQTLALFKEHLTHHVHLFL